MGTLAQLIQQDKFVFARTSVSSGRSSSICLSEPCSPASVGGGVVGGREVGELAMADGGSFNTGGLNDDRLTEDPGKLGLM